MSQSSFAQVEPHVSVTEKLLLVLLFNLAKSVSRDGAHSGQ